MKATRFVVQQHRNAKELFERMMNGNGDTVRMLDELGRTLLTHMLVEQVILFPEVLAPDDSHRGKAWDEHALERLELRRIHYTEKHYSDLGTTVSALKELLDRHIQGQEHELLPRAESVLPVAVNERLGEQMQKIFGVLVARSHRSDCTLTCCHGLSGMGSGVLPVRLSEPYSAMFRP